MGGSIPEKKSSNMPKIWQKMKKSLVQFALNPFFDDASIIFFFNYLVILVSDGSGTQNLGFGFGSSDVEKWVLKVKVNKAFFHFLPNFCHSCRFFKVEHAESTVKL